MKRLFNWLDDRTGYRTALKVALDEPVPGGASFAYVFGSVLTFVLLLQMVTGVFLAMYYSPSATDAWGSVAYIQDQVTMGWFVRGLHSYGASAMVIVGGLHLLQTAIYGAYKKPREINWLLGVMMYGLVMAFALTGYLLPWDQTGFWATKVATGIAGTSPLIGEQIQQGIQGGNEYGNLTLTRFFAIHVFILPAALIGLTVLHIALFRRHGSTPHWKPTAEQLKRRTQPFWPDQMFKDMVAMVIAFAAMVAMVIRTHGAKLDAPADPSSAFEARPEWYFRALFQALKYFEGAMEQVVALGLPVVIGGFLLSLPFLDRGPSRNPWKRLPFLGGLLVLGIGAGVLTVVSIAEDSADPRVQKALEQAEHNAKTARDLAKEFGVPPAGGPSVFRVNPVPFEAAKAIWAADCAGCHQGDAREAPEIGVGYNSRAWIAAFLKDPAGDRFYGRTKIEGMEPVELTGDEFAAIVEFVYSQSGARGVDTALVAKGQELFDGDGDCTNCHETDWDSSASGVPTLVRRGTRETLAEFIGNPGHERWFGSKNEMPLFYDKYNRQQRLELADYLIWLRDAPQETAE